MRPATIVNFERLIFATVALAAVQDVIGWHQMIAEAGNRFSNPTAFIIVTQVITFLILIGLTLLISRRGSRVAMWIALVLFALGIPAFIVLVQKGSLFGNGAISAIQTFVQLIAYSLLSTPSARIWMRNKRNVKAAISNRLDFVRL